MRKYSFQIGNLDCANCALKIEKELEKNEHYENVNLNFSRLKLTFVSDLKEYDVKNYTEAIIKKIEPDVVLSFENKTTNKSYWKDIIRLFIGIFVYSLSFLFTNYISDIFIITSYLILLYKVGIKALKLLPKLIFDENILLTISCFGAYFIDKKIEGLMVIVLYEIGKIFESIAVNNTRKSISSLMDIAPENANIKIKDKIIKTTPYDIKIGDILVVNLGEKIPVDGILLSKTANLDKSSLTGESKLVLIKENEEVLSGSINMEETIEIKATKLYSDSTISKILNLVETATSRKTKAENFIEKCAKIYTPIVMGIALLTFLTLPSLFSISYSESLYRALSFLVISCPCAIVISVPLSYFSGLGLASKNGILIKGSTYLDMARKIKKVVFDKTGTITTGTFAITNIVSLNTYSEDDIYKLIYYGEYYSTHPIAKSILSYKKVDMKGVKIKNIKEKPGLGISYEKGHHRYKIGNADFVKVKTKTNATTIYLSEDDQAIGYVQLKDQIKKESIAAIKALKQKGILTYMFTGDNREIAKEVKNCVGIDYYEYEMLPNDKYNHLDTLLKEKQKNEFIAFVGDGVNDAPVIALSDVGISMGLKGSNVAIESSDVVIMADSLEKINQLISISKYTNKVIIENLLFAFGIKLLFLVLAILGLTQMWMAVFADVGVTLLTILNTVKILKSKK